MSIETTPSSETQASCETTCSPEAPGEGGARQRRAYEVGAAMSRRRMECEAPDDAEALRAVEAADVVVVGGQYDHVEQVLGALELPFTPIRKTSLRKVKLRPEQLLIINCPGDVRSRDIPRIRDFVASGGSLFTTDWALKHVLEPAFPGIVEYNERPTKDDVVGIEVRAQGNPFLDGVLEDRDDPQWWLEGASYPIRILDRSRVEVLLESAELARKYGESPVAIAFDYGKGEVFHMISHYYLQRTELRTQRHRSRGSRYFGEKGLDMPAEACAAADELSLGEVESAASSTRFLANLVARKKRGQRSEKGRKGR